MKEVECQEAIFKYLKENLQCLSNNSVVLNREVPVPYRTLFGTRDNPSKMVVKCFNQDLCIYEKWPLHDLTSIKIDCSQQSAFLKTGGEKLGDYLCRPYVIIEVKIENDTNTFLSYKEKSRMIKECFPWAKYCLCMVGKGSPRLFEDGVTFDKIVVLPDTEKATFETGELVESIESLFIESVKRKEQYFQKVD